MSTIHVSKSFKVFLIMCLAAILLYLILPKYKFMGPNDFVAYRCNTVTGQMQMWDFDIKAWVTPNRLAIAKYGF